VFTARPNSSRYASARSELVTDVTDGVGEPVRIEKEVLELARLMEKAPNETAEDAADSLAPSSKSIANMRRWGWLVKRQ
jgi:hypothetical protein